MIGSPSDSSPPCTAAACCIGITCIMGMGYCIGEYIMGRLRCILRSGRELSFRGGCGWNGLAKQPLQTILDQKLLRTERFEFTV